MKSFIILTLLLGLSFFTLDCGGGHTQEDVDNAYKQGVDAGRQNEEDAYRRRKEEEERQRQYDRQEKLRNRGLKQIDSMPSN